MNNLMIGTLQIMGYDLNVSSVIDLPTKNLGGNTSATDQAEKGIKPKKLNISLTIPFKNPIWLSALADLAQARDNKGEAILYPISDPLAKALKIRKVLFSGQFTINEDEQWRQWSLTFTVQEYKSPAEIAEKRQDKREVSNQKASSFDDLLANIESKL